MTPRVLFVDDEANVLQGLRRGLRGLRKEWELLFAEGGAAALELMAEQSVDVVVSDMRMPGTDGATLLSEVSRLYPGTVRMVLSGQCEEEASLRLAATCHQFHSKPCDVDGLTSAIRQVLALRDQFSDPAMRELVVATDRLAVAPDIVTGIARVLELGEPEPEELFCLIAQDQALSAKILQLTNSSFFGITEAVCDPVRAARLLGAERLAKLISEHGLVDIDPLDQAHQTAFAAERQKSQICAALAERIAKDRGLGDAQVGIARITGFLHNIGSLLLLSRGSDQAADQGPASGTFLAALWGLPPVIVASLGNTAGLVCPRPPEGSDEVEILSVVRIAASLTQEATVPSAEPGDEEMNDLLADLGHGAELPAWRSLSRSLSQQEAGP